MKRPVSMLVLFGLVGVLAVAADDATRVVVTTPGDGFLSLRSEASTKAGRRLLKIPHGTLLSVTGCDGSTPDEAWCQTAYAGKQGWVYNRYLSYTDAKHAPEILRAVADVCTRAWCEASVEKLIGDYASVLLACTKQDCESAIAFLARKKGRWTLVDYGTGLTPQDLVGYGFPPDVARHLVPW